MRETDFIKKNEAKWAEYEATLNRERQDPKKLGELYVHATDDLSYSRTFYPNRSVRVYLNGLAQRIFLQIYRGRRGEAGRFLTFWTDELPRLLFAHRRTLLLSLLLFAVAMLIGVISYRIDPQFAEFILGDQYVEMTRENIRNGDPMAVYKQRGEFDMFLAITFNNIYVAFQVFVMGAFYAVGTVFLLMSNGVMVGVFQYFFVEEGLFRESFLTIWIHGALEISSIVIAGAAGLVMGGGLLFPGTYSRARAFAQSARAGFKIMLGTVPLFIVAGFLEGFLTRQTQLHDSLRLVFILLCFAFILWYYWYYPRQVVNKQPQDARDQRLGYRERPAGELLIVADRIKMIGEIMTETLLITGQQIGRLLNGLLLTAGVYCLLVFTLTATSVANRFTFDGSFFGFFYNIYALFSTFGLGKDVGFFLAVYAGFLLLSLLVCQLIEVKLHPLHAAGFRVAKLRRLLLPALLFTLCFSLPGGWMLLVTFLSLPLLCTYAYLRYQGLGDFRTAFRFTYTYLVSSYGIYLLLSLLGFFGFFLMDTAVTKLIFGLLNWLISGNSITLYNLNVIIQAGLYFLYFGLVFTTWVTAFALNFHSNREREEALGLLQEIQLIGRERRLRGLETE